MSKRPSGTMGGVLLVGVGLLLVALSFGEQPDRINLGLHRFYSEADRDEFQSVKEHVVNLKKGLGGAPENGAENILASNAQVVSEVDDHLPQSALKGSSAPATAEANFADLKQKQFDAFRNQDNLSLTLKSIGITCLAVGAFFLMRVSRAKRVAQNVDGLEWAKSLA